MTDQERRLICDALDSYAEHCSRDERPNTAIEARVLASRIGAPLRRAAAKKRVEELRNALDGAIAELKRLDARKEAE